MPMIRIPAPLRTYTNGDKEVQVPGDTVGEALENFTDRYPELRPHLFNGHGELRAFVNLFLNEDNIRDLQGVQTSLQADDRLMLVPSVAGG